MLRAGAREAGRRSVLRAPAQARGGIFRTSLSLGGQISLAALCSWANSPHYFGSNNADSQARFDLSASNLRRLGRTLSPEDTAPHSRRRARPDAVRYAGSESDWNGLLPAYFAE